MAPFFHPHRPLLIILAFSNPRWVLDIVSLSFLRMTKGILENLPKWKEQKEGAQIWSEITSTQKHLGVGWWRIIEGGSGRHGLKCKNICETVPRTWHYKINDGVDDLSKGACTSHPRQRKNKAMERRCQWKSVCTGPKCWAEKLTFVISFCVCQWHSSWESKLCLKRNA